MKSQQKSAYLQKITNFVQMLKIIFQATCASPYYLYPLPLGAHDHVSCSGATNLLVVEVCDVRIQLFKFGIEAFISEDQVPRVYVQF